MRITYSALALAHDLSLALADRELDHAASDAAGRQLTLDMWYLWFWTMLRLTAAVDTPHRAKWFAILIHKGCLDLPMPTTCAPLALSARCGHLSASWLCTSSFSHTCFSTCIQFQGLDIHPTISFFLAYTGRPLGRVYAFYELMFSMCLVFEDLGDVGQRSCSPVSASRQASRHHGSEYRKSGAVWLARSQSCGPTYLYHPLPC